MSEEVAIGGLLLCALVIDVAVGTLIGAVFLRAAVALYNKMAGGASSLGGVPEPAMGRAMWIIFATFLAQLVVGFFIVGVTGPGPTAAGAQGQGSDVVTQLISFPVGFLIMAGYCPRGCRRLLDVPSSLHCATCS
jgi:hypothetical protein